MSKPRSSLREAPELCHSRWSSCIASSEEHRQTETQGNRHPQKMEGCAALTCTWCLAAFTHAGPAQNASAPAAVSATVKLFPTAQARLFPRAKGNKLYLPRALTERVSNTSRAFTETQTAPRERGAGPACPEPSGQPQPGKLLTTL